MFYIRMHDPISVQNPMHTYAFSDVIWSGKIRSIVYRTYNYNLVTAVAANNVYLEWELSYYQ